MIKVKIFVDTRPGKVEEKVNHWFANEAGAVYVVKTETAVAGVTELRDGGTSPCIVVTIWYEPEGAQQGALLHSN